jgi:hypothetical protein
VRPTTRSSSQPARAFLVTCRYPAASSTASISQWTISTTAPGQSPRVGTAGELSPALERPITAAGKHVIVIGGGDTGADCVANAHRENAPR